jgi:hypothetical protein
MTNNLKFLFIFIFYHRALVKQYHFMTHLLSHFKHHSVLHLLQNPPLCSSAYCTINIVRTFPYCQKLSLCCRRCEILVFLTIELSFRSVTDYFSVRPLYSKQNVHDQQRKFIVLKYSYMHKLSVY